MSDAIIVALISGGLTFAGTAISCVAALRKNQQNTQTAQAVTDTKIEELTRETRLHNNFAQRVPVIEEQIKVINHRISDLEEERK